MTLRIGRAVGRGVRRSLNPTGLLLAVLTLGYVLAVTAATNTLVAAALPAAVRGEAGIGLVLPAPPAVAGAVAVVAFLFGMVVYLATARAFVGDPVTSPTRSLFTRRIGRALVSAVGANVVVSVSVSIGFVLLVVPGLFLMASFAFVVFAVAVEDARAMPALRRSWSLARGNRWRLLALLAIISVGVGVPATLGSLVAVVDPAAGQVASLVVTAPLAVASYGVLADAFDQLRGEAPAGD